MSTALSLKNISYSYHTVQGETCALKDISLDIPKGSFVSVVGPSGCGKSTLLSIIAGIIRPDSGRILINGRDISPGNDSIGYMLQHDHLFEWRSIYGNVMLGLEIKRRKKPDDTSYVDEPFSALDYQTRLTVCDDIYSIIKKEHKTAVLVTHDLSEAISVGDTVYVLSRRPGRIARSVSVDFPADLTPLMRRNAPEFKDYFNILWKELNENG